jgi:hypothetical protein
LEALDEMRHNREGTSIILPLYTRPAGEPAVDTPDSLAVDADPFWRGDEHTSRTIAVAAPDPPAVGAGCSFIPPVFFRHQHFPRRQQG